MKFILRQNLNKTYFIFSCKILHKKLQKPSNPSHLKVQERKHQQILINLQYNYQINQSCKNQQDQSQNIPIHKNYLNRTFEILFVEKSNTKKNKLMIQKYFDKQQQSRVYHSIKKNSIILLFVLKTIPKLIDIKYIYFLYFLVMANYLKPLIICGPSGVGKGTLIKALLRNKQSPFLLNLSYTTRLPRDYQRDGVHYFFVTKHQFQEKIKNNLLMEYELVHGNLYGTSIVSLNNIRKQNKIPILDIDIKGAKKLMNKMETENLCILSPSEQVLITRLKGRNSQTEQSLKIRVQRGKQEVREILQTKKFICIVNYDVALTSYCLKYFLKNKYNIEFNSTFQ